MINIIKFVAEVRHRGVVSAIRKAAKRLPWASDRGDPIHKRRVELFAQLNASLNYTVKYGPFAGMKIPSEAYWAGPDRAPMLLGIYEQEVVQAIADHRSKKGVFIDVGAADGYYAVGVLLAGWFRRSYCFEISEVGQSVIRRNAEKNEVSENLIVFGAANPDFYNLIPHDELEGAVILVDIEGGEFDLLDAAALYALKSATIIVEVHPWVIDGDRKVLELAERAHLTHRVSSFKTGARDPSQFGELNALGDNDRWLICSEDRPVLMSWILLERRI
jgi:precorrin-6B methylase 2